MSAVTNVTEEGDYVDAASASHRESNDTAPTRDSGDVIEKKDDTTAESQDIEASTPHTEPKVQVSAHEQDREVQASRRIKEAQRYHERDKGSKGSLRGGRGGYKNRNRFDPTKLEKSDDPVAIRKQVEFYFSESNLLTDKFLFEKVEGHKNVPVSIDVIHSFKRMQHFQPRDAVVKALKDSFVLEVVDDDTAVRRKVPLPENLIGKSMDEVQKVHEDQSMAKSIYAKGFGEEEPTTQFDIEAWFANHGLTNSVRLRRDNSKRFKGSVFVEFDTEETQQKFLALNPPAKWRGKDLEIKSKKEYCDAKVDDINQGRIRRNSPDPRYQDRKDKRPRRGSPTYDEKRHNYVESDDDRDWRQRRNEEAANGYRGSKQKGHASSGRRDRRHQHIERDSRDRKVEGSESLDPASAKVNSPQLSAANGAQEEDHLDKSGSSMEIAISPAASTADRSAVKRKRSYEDEGDEGNQRTTKKADLKGDIFPFVGPVENRSGFKETHRM